MDGPTELAWQAQRDAALRLAEIWRELVEGTVRAATQAPAGGEQVAALARQVAEYAAVAAQPLRDLLAGQRDFAEHVGRWADMQREIADGMATWSAHQQEHLDALDRLLPPYGPH
jgi:hypothetical protein